MLSFFLEYLRLRSLTRFRASEGRLNLNGPRPDVKTEGAGSKPISPKLGSALFWIEKKPSTQTATPT